MDADEKAAFQRVLDGIGDRRDPAFELVPRFGGRQAGKTDAVRAAMARDVTPGDFLVTSDKRILGRDADEGTFAVPMKTRNLKIE